MFFICKSVLKGFSLQHQNKQLCEYVPRGHLLSQEIDMRLLSFCFVYLFLSDKVLYWVFFNLPKIFLLHLVNGTAFGVLYNKFVFVVQRILEVFDSPFCFFTSQGRKSLFYFNLKFSSLKRCLVNWTKNVIVCKKKQNCWTGVVAQW